ncbi:MAG: hypothetical protein ABR608_07240 [Pseudonocardiaceae bacterium]
MSNPQDPYAPRSGDLPPAPPPPPAGWPVPAGGPPPPAGWPGPAGGPPPPVPVARPATVVGAVVFWVLSGLTMLVSGAVTVAAAGTQEAKQALADVFAESQLRVSDAVIEQLLIGAGLASLAVGLLTIAFGVGLLGGANWARVTVTVLGLLGVLIVLFPALFVVLAIVLQFVPSSNAWFRARAARRAG